MKSRSIKKQILIGVNLIIFGVLVLASIVNYFRALHEIDEMFDAQLAQTSRLLAKLVESDPDILKRQSPVVIAIPEITLSLVEVPSAMERLKDGHKYEGQIGFQVWTDSGELLLKSENTGNTPLAPLEQGYFELKDANHHWISFSLHDAHSGIWLQTGQRVELRNELSLYLASSQIGQVVIAILFLSGLIYFLVNRSFAPIEQFCDQLKQSKPAELTPIYSELPTEIKPIQTAINHLLSNISEHIVQEKRFTADASHELRTPLAVLQLHAHNISLADNIDEREKSIRAVISSAQRMTHLINQLMALAKVDQKSQLQLEDLSVISLTEYSLSLLSREQSERVDWQIDIANNAVWIGDKSLMQVVFRNLLDNATKYAKSNSIVKIKSFMHNGLCKVCIENEVSLEINTDTSRMTDRFYRNSAHQNTEGAGLGLSIVKQILILHKATIEINNIKPGLICVCIQEDTRHF